MEVDKKDNVFNQELDSSLGFTTVRDSILYAEGRFFEGSGPVRSKSMKRELLWSDVGI